MADEKTPQTAPDAEAEATPAAPDEATAAPDEATAAPDEATATAAAEPAAEAAPAAPRATRRDRLETRRAQARPAARGQVSPEQREQERQARRAATAKQRRAYRAKLKQRRAAGDRTATEPLQATAHERGRPRERQGVVTSAKGDKTITVKIDVVRRHRRYHKILRSTLKLYAHDEANNAAEGDTVRVVECRPMSRTKRWRLTEVLERAK
jgi:small subunit ribosomal protein S17